MPLTKANWVPNEELAVGKGATIQQFFAAVDGDRFEINVAPWGEGQLVVNGREIARTAEAKDRRQAFSTLKQAAERYVRGDPVDLTGNGKIRLIPAVKAKLLQGKKGLVVGIANERSIAWGCAAAFRAFGADLAVTYLDDKTRKHVDPLACELEAKIVMPLDARVPGQMEASFLVNLFKFVAWPRTTETATICFLQPSQVQSRLEFGLSTHQKWAQLKDRTLVVKLLSDPKDAVNARCQILYLDSHTAERLWPFPVPNAVLTASNGKDFAYHGGMIQFVWDAADTYRIAINTDNVTRSGLVVSGALGTLADRVDDARFSH